MVVKGEYVNGDVKTTNMCFITEELERFTKSVCNHLCSIIKSEIEVEVEPFDNSANLKVYRLDGTILSTNYGEHNLDTKNFKEAVSECVESLYLGYVDKNIDVKIEMLGF